MFGIRVAFGPFSVYQPRSDVLKSILDGTVGIGGDPVGSTDSDGRWLSVSAAGRAIGVSRTTLLAAEDAGLIAPVRTPGGHRRYGLAELERYLDRAGAGRIDLPAAESAPPTRPAAGVSAVEAAHLAAAGRAAVRPLVQAVDAECAGLYLLQDAELRFCAAFGIPRWLTERLSAAAPPDPVRQAFEGARHRLFDPAAVAFPEPRATGQGLAIAFRRADLPIGVLFVVTHRNRELLPGELRVVEAFRELIAVVVEDQLRIVGLERRLAQIATLSAHPEP